MVEIVPLAEAAEHEIAAGIIKDAIYADSEPTTLEKIRARIASSDIVLGALEDGRIVSIAIGSVRGGKNTRLDVGEIATLPEYRGRKIGESLIQALEERGRKAGARFATLFSLDDSVPFYERLGYSNYFGTGEMVKALKANNNGS